MMLSIREQRMERHLQARGEMEKGDFRDALNTLKSTQVEFGEHIFITLDLAACYYMIHDYYQFEKLSRKGHEDFCKYRDILNEKTFILSANALGKYFEELGDLILSLKMYDEATARIENQDISLTAQIHAQRLRLKSFLGIEDRFSADYAICEKAFKALKSNPLTAVTFELGHALLMADHFIRSKEMAHHRFVEMFSCISEAYQKRLLLVDHLVERAYFFSSGHDLRFGFDELLGEIPYFEADPYERAILNLMENKYIDWAQLDLMSLQGKIRYLIFLRKFSEELSLNGDEVEERFNLVLRMFTPESRILIKKRWKILDSDGLLQLEVFDRIVLISKGSMVLKFSRTSLYGKILELSARNRDQKEILVDTVLKELYQEELTMHGFEKLRQLVFRLNQKIKDSLLVDKFLAISNNGITQLARYQCSIETK